MAGLSAATALLAAASAPLTVDVFDMGRAPGGRCASRHTDVGGGGAGDGSGTLSFDYGAQFVVARSPAFQQQVAEWQAAGVVAEWRGRHGRITAGGTFEEASPSSLQGGFCGALSGLPLYVGTPTNSSICQHMAQQLQQQRGPSTASGRLHSGVRVTSMEQQQQQQRTNSSSSSDAASSGCCGSGGVQWRLGGSRQGRAGAAAAEVAEDLGLFDAVILADAMPVLPGAAAKCGEGQGG